MSAKVIPLNQKKNQIRALLDTMLLDHPPHCAPDVVDCLKTELEKILETYLIEDAPELWVTLPENLTGEQLHIIRNGIDQAFTRYNELMIHRSKQLFRDLYLSKLEICELRQSDTSKGDPL